MADIITFVPRERGGDPRPEEPAAIIIFPGVRYERADQGLVGDAAPRQSQTRGRRSRRRN